MANKKQVSGLDLQNIFLENVRIENVSLNPTFSSSESGRMIHNITDNKSYINDGTEISQICRKKEFVITGDGNNKDFTLVHNLNSKHIMVSMRRDSDGKIMNPNLLTINNLNEIIIRPTSNAPNTGVIYNITIIG